MLTASRETGFAVKDREVDSRAETDLDNVPHAVVTDAVADS